MDMIVDVALKLLGHVAHDNMHAEPTMSEAS
jgi:hypothetical protein